MKKLPCDGKPRVCPGQCNPRSISGRGYSCSRRGDELVPYRQENVVNRNVYCKHEFALFSKKPADPLDSPSGLSPEEREFVEAVSRRIEARRRGRAERELRCSGRRFLAFLLFFFLHGCIAALANNYEHYQTFLATQFCGFVAIMFWDAT